MSDSPKQRTAPERVKSSLRRQRRVLLIAVVAVVLLAVVLGLTVYFTSRTVFVDPIDDAKYYIVQVDGKYVMCTANKEILQKTQDGNYVTSSGTIVYVNSKTGEYNVVATVLLEGNEATKFDALSAKYDVLLYPILEQKDILSIRVCNEYGDYTFKKGPADFGDGKTTAFYPLQRPDLSVSETAIFATLVSFTGYTRTMMRLDAEKVKENGYAEYGLPDNPADATKFFVITAMDGTEHRVILGDEIPSGSGYYARYADREAVYILCELSETEYNTTVKKAMFSPLEAYIVPVAASSQMTGTNYFDVTDFILYRKEDRSNPLVSFSYAGSNVKRNNTFLSSTPYVTLANLKGYSVNSYRVDECLRQLYEWSPSSVVTLGVADQSEADVSAWLAQYGLDSSSYLCRLSFTLNISRNYDKTTGVDTVPNTAQERHEILISEKQEDGNYYVYNMCSVYNTKTKAWQAAPGYDMIVAISADQMNFIFWNVSDWIENSVFSNNIAYCEELEVTVGSGDISGIFPQGYHQTFYLDNSETLASIGSGNLTSDKIKISDSTNTAMDVMQFRRFYQTLLYSSLIGESSLTQAQQQQYLSKAETENNSDPALTDAALVIRMKYVLSELDTKTGRYEETGEIVERTYCFYHDYSYPREAFLALREVDEAGNGDFYGEFYISRTRMEKIIRDIAKLYTPEEAINPTGTY